MRPDWIGVGLVKLLRFPVYPYLLFLVFPLNFYSVNTNLFTAFSVVRLLVVLIIVCAGIIWAGRRMTRSCDLAAYAAGAAAIVFLGVEPTRFEVSVATACVVVLFAAVWRSGHWRQLTVVANVVALAMVATSLAVIVSSGFASSRGAASEARPEWRASIELDAAGRPPESSFVHIVLDGYASRTALREVFDFDNGPFSEGLEKLGFRVFEDVATPFNQTLPSMTAVMNLEPPDFDAPPLADISDDAKRRVLGRRVLDGSVIQLFRELGYAVYYTVSGYEVFNYPSTGTTLREESNLLEFSQFDFYFLLPRLDKWGLKLAGGPAISASLDRHLKHALSFDGFSELRQPFLYYSHMIAPHPPFAIDEHGEITDRWGFYFMGDGHFVIPTEEAAARYRGGYLEKLRYTNRAVLALAERIIASVQGPLTIVIHGDHGSGLLFNQDSAAATCLLDRMFTTAAVYSNLAEIRAAFDQRGLSNIANIYRVALGAMFDADLPDLDIQYFVPWSNLADPVALAGVDIRRNCG